MDAILVRILRACQWTCDPKPAGAPGDTEAWSKPSSTSSFWVLRADACVTEWQRTSRIEGLQGAVRFALDLPRPQVGTVGAVFAELGRRIGLLESADEALDDVDRLLVYAPLADAGVTTVAALREHAGKLIGLAGLTLEAWLASREAVARG